VISLTDYGHEGSALNLLGPDGTREQREALSTHRLVDQSTPPCFLWHTEEDEPVPVENSLFFASALRRNGVPFELHVFEEGAHGIGMGGDPPHLWSGCLIRWMTFRGWARPS
jgi:dipeptidyl aminopeptidase/acylaminoacyl peptidase